MSQQPIQEIFELTMQRFRKSIEFEESQGMPMPETTQISKILIQLEQELWNRNQATGNDSIVDDGFIDLVDVPAPKRKKDKRA